MSLVVLWAKGKGQRAKGKWKGESCPVQPREGAEPCTKPFSILRAHKTNPATRGGTTQQDGHIEKVNRLEWASPSSVSSKQNKTVGSINDFRELNMKRIKRILCLLPKVWDTLLKLEGFQHATSLDINMGWYQIWLDRESSKLCASGFLGGKFKMSAFLMGLCELPDML
jgi:hypothetical protein